jgi:MerR family mercuric resistance operon transcriptional regulator
MVQSQGIEGLTIAKLASAGGVGVETIRFYQRKGLLETPTPDGGIRRYRGEDLRRLRFIRHAQAAGFTLEEIKKLLALDATDDRATVRALAKARVKALDEQIRKLRVSRDALKRLEADCAHGEEGPCPILEAFEMPQSSCSRSAR